MNEQFKRWNIPRGTTISESPNGEFYHCADFDTLAQRLQEAERLNDRMASLLRSIRRHNSSGLTLDTQDEIDAVLAGKGDKP